MKTKYLFQIRLGIGFPDSIDGSFEPRFSLFCFPPFLDLLDENNGDALVTETQEWDTHH